MCVVTEEKGEGKGKQRYNREIWQLASRGRRKKKRVNPITDSLSNGNAKALVVLCVIKKIFFFRIMCLNEISVD